MSLSPADVRADPAGDGRREANAAAVFRAVLDHGPTARSAIARMSGLSPAAVSRQFLGLARLGLVRERPELAVGGHVGRPQVPVDIDTAGPLVGGLHIGLSHSMYCLLDLRANVVARGGATHAGRTGGAVLDPVLDRLPAFLAERAGGRPVLGFGAVTGGWVDPEAGAVVRHAALGLRELPLRAPLERALGVPVHVDNHARAIARAEILFGRPEARRGVVHLFIGNVVDAAVGVAGVVHQGPRSAAGDIAHLPVGARGARCPCGRTGCLQATASDLALAERAVAEGVVPDPDVSLLVDAAAAGDPRADRLLRQRAQHVGRAAALLTDVLNPDVVLVTETSSLLNPEYLEVMGAELAERSHVCDDPARLVGPHAGPAVLPVAGGAPALAALYRSPLRSTGAAPAGAAV
ncbi:ROK family transcriptional regulator [Streptomyces marincola]|uniref:ROK family transcriptional regulator n=1 Tax=Streptomyces marincola TaxID=2878388 RepID=UPI001CF1D991|nr:ROK family protein [Streptomyces marincola]UCM91155.1 ROK family protein [Streptomyces marincola]